MACDILTTTVNSICETLGVSNGSVKFGSALKRTKYQSSGDLIITCDNILKRFTQLPSAKELNPENESCKHNVTFDLCTSDSACSGCLELKFLIAESREWQLHINRLLVKNSQLVLYFERTSAYKYILKDILSQNLRYGVSTDRQKGIFVESSSPHDCDNIKDLSDLRLSYLKQCISNIAKAAGYCIHDSRQSENDIGLYLTTKSGINAVEDVKTIVCGVVINAESGAKEMMIQAEEYLSHRVCNMKAMAVHKYGGNVNNDAVWNSLLTSLADAAVKMEFLSVKPSQTVVANIEANYKDCKGGTFVLYNYARICSIMQQFHEKEAKHIYPTLFPLENIDFSLLTDEDEWELLHLIMEYPSICLNSASGIEKGTVKPHFICSFLCKLSKIFSTYYRRIRILREPRPHMIPTIFARIYLLKGIEIVMYNALALLGIEPVRQM